MPLIEPARGWRIVHDESAVRWVDPHTYEQHQNNMKVCQRLQTFVHGRRYDCTDCRRETPKQWELCHKYPIMYSYGKLGTDEYFQYKYRVRR